MNVLFGDLRLPSKFWVKVKRQRNGCWYWTGYIDKQGYGQYTVSKNDHRLPHREIYEILVEQLPERRGEPNHRQVDHECHNRSKSCPGGPTCLHRRCVNPTHLKAKTAKENVLAGKGRAAKNAVATHCSEGHEFSPENTYVTKLGQRQCKRCQIDHSRENKRAKAALLPKQPHYQTVKTHCPNGHPYAGDNLYIRADGARSCKACMATRTAEHRERVRGGPGLGHQRDRTHCVAGHELVGENLYVAPGSGKRGCRACKRARAQSKVH